MKCIKSDQWLTASTREELGKLLGFNFCSSFSVTCVHTWVSYLLENILVIFSRTYVTLFRKLHNWCSSFSNIFLLRPWDLRSICKMDGIYWILVYSSFIQFLLLLDEHIQKVWFHRFTTSKEVSTLMMDTKDL